MAECGEPGRAAWQVERTALRPPESRHECSLILHRSHASSSCPIRVPDASAT